MEMAGFICSEIRHDSKVTHWYHNQLCEIPRPNGVSRAGM